MFKKFSETYGEVKQWPNDKLRPKKKNTLPELMEQSEIDEPCRPRFLSWFHDSITKKNRYQS